MKRIFISCIYTLCGILCYSNAVAQDEFGLFNLFGKGKPMKLNGSLNASMILNSSSDNLSQREPFTYMLGGSLVLFYKGIDIPVTFTYSNNTATIAAPISYNKVAIHPHYKWVTLHLGTTSLLYSPYTLNGHQFTGAGIDLTPGKLKVSAMYGRLLKGSGDYTENLNALPTYSRMGGGMMAEYKWDKFMLGATVFGAKDDPKSASNIPAEFNVTPKENLAVSAKTEVHLIKSLNFSAEYARNYLTNDVTSDAPNPNKYQVASDIIKMNGTTVAQQAYNAKLSYAWRFIDAGVEYERVDPNYRCLGSYTNINGFENELFKLGLSLFNYKLIIASSVGLQKDITEGDASQNSKRAVYSSNLTANLSNRLTVTGNVSNFKSITNFRNLDNISNKNNITPYYLDSLKLAVISLNAGGTINYQLSTDNQAQKTLSGSYSIQQGSKTMGEITVDEDGNMFHNGTVMYSSNSMKSNIMWTLAMNYSESVLGTNNKTVAYGPDVTISRKLLKKTLILMLGGSYNTTNNNLVSSNADVLNLRLNASYNLKKVHTFNLCNVFQLKNSAQVNTPSVHANTLLISFNYNYSF